MEIHHQTWSYFTANWKLTFWWNAMFLVGIPCPADASRLAEQGTSVVPEKVPSFCTLENKLHVWWCISKSYQPFLIILEPTWSCDTPLQNARSLVTFCQPEILTGVQEQTQATHWCSYHKFVIRKDFQDRKITLNHEFWKCVWQNFVSITFNTNEKRIFQIISDFRELWVGNHHFLLADTLVGNHHSTQ